MSVASVQGRMQSATRDAVEVDPHDGYHPLAASCPFTSYSAARQVRIALGERK